MKKKGRKYRKIQKAKEIKVLATQNNVEQEVNGIKISYLSMAHIVCQNPILCDSIENKKMYISCLKHYLRIGGWNRRKYESSLMDAYETIINKAENGTATHQMLYYRNFILMDLIHILGYEIGGSSSGKLKRIEAEYIKDFSVTNPEDNLSGKIVKAIFGSGKTVSSLQKKLQYAEEIQYIKLIKTNQVFQKKNPYRITVTATMSAGKSTFINSLIGKYVCLSQNMACTNKIHSIINKSFEDGYSYEYDHDLVMTAGKEELLNDNELNTSDKIYVSTHFCGGLEDERVVINDSPGVNFSGDREHKEIAAKLLKGRKYNLLIYVMNSTQLATNDEDEHLDFVKHTIGRTPVMFVMNKIDSYNVEDENVIETIQKQTEYLKKKGFKNPIVCPVSARAGYLAKQFMTRTLTRNENRELYNYVDKLEQMKLTEYYASHFPKIVIQDKENEEEQLLKTSGLAYVEQIIKGYIKGGN